MSSRFKVSRALKITLMAVALVASVVLALAVNAYYGFVSLVALGLGVWLAADVWTVRDMERSIEGGTAPRHHELVGKEAVAEFRKALCLLEGGRVTGKADRVRVPVGSLSKGQGSFIEALRRFASALDRC